MRLFRRVLEALEIKDAASLLPQSARAAETLPGTEALPEEPTELRLGGEL